MILNKINKNIESDLAIKLREIVRLPQLDYLKDTIEIGYWGENGSYGNLFLSSKGLEEITGYCDMSNAEVSRRNDPRKIESLSDFNRIITNYKISEKDLYQLRSNLEK